MFNNNFYCYLSLLVQQLQPSDLSGYYKISLTNGDNKKQHLAHRLVAEYFVENQDPDNFKIVDHIDGNKLNNHFSNLRWTTSSENTKNWQSQRTNHNKIEQYDLDGNLIKTWDSSASIAKELNFNSGSLRACIHDKLKYKGSFWKYVKEDRKHQCKLDVDLNDYVCIGTIKGLDFSRYSISKDGSSIIHKITEKEITFNITEYGYKVVNLSYNQKSRKTLYVHKIINQVLKNGDYNDTIDHVDGDTQNNSLDNLEVVTQKENMIRACGKSVRQIKIDTGETIEIFRTIREACVKLNRKCSGSIVRVCNGTSKSSCGSKWEWNDQYNI